MGLHRQRRRRGGGVILAIGLAAVAVLAVDPVARAATVNVSTTAQLESAVANASNGDVIVLAAGTYAPAATLDPSVNITLQGPTTAPGATITGASVQPDPQTGVDDVLDIDPGVAVTIQNLTFVGAKADAVGIDAVGTLTLDSSTLTQNQGLAVWITGSDTVRNTTVSGNSATGVMVDGTTNLINVTIAENTGTGLANANPASVTTLKNTIVWGNGAGDCLRPVETSVNSLDGDRTCGVGTLSGRNPLLGPLASNGGPTQTRALPGSSPAVNAGTNTGCPSVDQRGIQRNDGSCDVGAYEYVDSTPPTITTPGNLTVPADSLSGAVVNYTVTFSDPDDAVATSGCTPPSGSLFPLGTTTVNCTATDTHHNTRTASFSVDVTTRTGIGCHGDGKISGRGGLLFGPAEAALANGFRDDVCGSVTDAAGNTMSVYNYDALVGSDVGQAAASCRTDAFTASDVPYTESSLASMNAAPGAVGCSEFSGVTSPVEPEPGPYPNSADTSTAVMSFPVGGTSVAIGVNLTCGGTQVTALNLTSSLASRLLGGDVKWWDDAELVAANGSLAGCHVPVQRVVRMDKATTTQVVKNYLVNADNARSTSTKCFTGGTWSSLATDANNTVWPVDNGTSCSALVVPTSPGSGPQLSLCASTAGAICYGDLPVIVNPPGDTLALASLRNSTGTSFQGPLVGSSKANCNLGVLTLPAGGARGAVGLNTGASADNWATNGPAGNRGDVTFKGPAYPICELTYALVYTHLKTTGTGISRLTFDQRQTLYAFFSYILSSAGQDRLSSADYQPLPASIISSLRSGFQANF